MKVKSFSHVQLFATPWTVAYEAPQSTLCNAKKCITPDSSSPSTISQSMIKFMSIESVMLSNLLILCRPHLLSQHQGLFQWVISSYQLAKVWELQHKNRLCLFWTIQQMVLYTRWLLSLSVMFSSYVHGIAVSVLYFILIIKFLSWKHSNIYKRRNNIIIPTDSTSSFIISINSWLILVVKYLLANAGDARNIQSLGQEDPLE